MHAANVGCVRRSRVVAGTVLLTVRKHNDAYRAAGHERIGGARAIEVDVWAWGTRDLIREVGIGRPHVASERRVRTCCTVRVRGCRRKLWPTETSESGRRRATCKAAVAPRAHQHSLRLIERHRNSRCVGAPVERIWQGGECAVRERTRRRNARGRSATCRVVVVRIGSGAATDAEGLHAEGRVTNSVGDVANRACEVIDALA